MSSEDGITVRQSLQITSVTKSANSGLMHRSNQHPYSITSSAMESGLSGTSMPVALAPGRARLGTRPNRTEAGRGEQCGGRFSLILF
jgi:hypothetical protein